MNDIISLDDPFIRGLACAAIHPGLRSILILNSSSAEQEWAADILLKMLYVVEGTNIDKVTLGTTESDDVLWGSLALKEKPNGLDFGWETGLLRGGRRQKYKDEYKIIQQLICIPNLTCLSLAAMRTIVMALNSDVIHLERHGQNERWRPCICWLAGCDTAEIGQISPHLLDRFLLRLQIPVSTVKDDEKRLTNLLHMLHEDKQERKPIDELPEDLVDILVQASLLDYPKIKDDAIAYIPKYFPIGMDVSTLRREIALGRLSVANAAIKQVSEVTTSDIGKAAKIIGLKKPDEHFSESSDLSDKILSPSHSDPKPSPDSLLNNEKDNDNGPLLNNPLVPNTPLETGSESKSLHNSDTEHRFPPSPLSPKILSPYPEDNAEIDREFTPLKLPIRTPGKKGSARGTVIGIERATNLYDIAVINTIFEAVKFHSIRCKQKKDNQFRILSTDLRRYRRAPIPEKILVLIIDYTCLKEVDIEYSLIEYLQWAFIERSSVCLIRGGS
ncbi:MAG: hypothetical protein ACFFCW_28645, partial [Candidatus Hodarchaeota archaeon]